MISAVFMILALLVKIGRIIYGKQLKFVWKSMLSFHFGYLLTALRSYTYY